MENCPCMSQFDCERDPSNINFKCMITEDGDGMGICIAMDQPPPEGPGFADAVIAGTSLEPALLGWHVILIVFVIIIACAVAAVVLYIAQTGGPPPDREPLNGDTVLHMMNETGTLNGTHATSSPFLPTYTGGGGTVGALEDTSLGTYAQVPNAPTYSCDVCGKEYHFMSDVEAHKAARHA